MAGRQTLSYSDMGLKGGGGDYLCYYQRVSFAHTAYDSYLTTAAPCLTHTLHRAHAQPIHLYHTLHTCSHHLVHLLLPWWRWLTWRGWISSGHATSSSFWKRGGGGGISLFCQQWQDMLR